MLKKQGKQLKEGEPIEYVRGFVEFLGCRIDLSKKPFIPRPETEFWVEKALETIYYDFQSFENRSIRVLDIFSGSGCIGLAALRCVYCATVDFAEKDKKAIEQIKINLKINNIKSNRYKIIQSDVFDGLDPSSRRLLRTKYDFVFANPPYVADYRKSPSTRLRTILRNRVQKSVLEFEPKKALFAGKGGLFYIKKFLKQVKNYLNPDGRVFMEFSPEQKKEIEKLIAEYNYKSYKFHRDQYGRWRWVMIE